MGSGEAPGESGPRATASVVVVDFKRKPQYGSLKVALLRPPWTTLRESIGFIPPTPPVGIAYIAAALRETGHVVQMIDAPSEAIEFAEDVKIAGDRTVRRIGLRPAEMIERIEPGTKMIGITNMFVQEWPVVREIANLCRERFPDAFIVVGGENATSFWPWMFEQCDSIDAAVLGEGEATACELAGRLAAGVSIADMGGIALRDGADRSATSGGLPPRIKNLDAIPRPAWDLFDMESYFEHRCAMGVDRGRSIPILATRGCPYKCTFCSSPQMWTTRYGVRDPIELVDEIEEYVNRYQVSNLDFVDLTPITKRSWILRFCDELERRDLHLSLQLPIGTRSEALDDEVLTRMAAAGCTNITFAPETGSERMLEIYDKRLDLGHLVEGIQAARRAGMVTNIHMILGHPAERWKDRWYNWKFMMRAAFAGLHSAGTTLFFPYPGSKDFQDLYDAGKITVDDTFCFDGLSRGGGAAYSWNDQASPKVLHYLQLWNVLTFMAVSHVLNPRQTLHLIKNLVFGGEEHTYIEQGLRTKRIGPMSRKRPGMVTVQADPAARPEPVEVPDAATASVG